MVLRHRKTTYTFDAEYTPSRNKFPSDPEEGGVYTGWEFTGGVRHPLNDRVRLRLEALFDREDFENPLLVALGRNSTGSEWMGQVNVAPAKGLDLRMLGTVAHTETEARKYRKDERTFGLGAAWSDSLWRLDASTESGTKRYPDAVAGDSNFERRDQWIEAVLKATRKVSAGLALSAAAQLTDQTSSRSDKNYNVWKYTLGLEWTGGGK